jgi:hypothetical protein
MTAAHPRLRPAGAQGRGPPDCQEAAADAPLECGALPLSGLLWRLLLSVGAAHAALGGSGGVRRSEGAEAAHPRAFAVICHFPADGPNGQTIVSSSYFGCPPLDEGSANPFGEE